MKGWSLVGLALVAAACAPVQMRAPTADLTAKAEVPGFVFATDTFGFPNEVRAHNPRAEYANYCFVLARSLRQFFLFARFDPDAPRLSSEEYVERVRAVDVSGWEDACAGLPLSHMGRGPEDDPWFFAVAYAAGRVASGHLR